MVAASKRCALDGFRHGPTGGLSGLMDGIRCCVTDTVCGMATAGNAPESDMAMLQAVGAGYRVRPPAQGALSAHGWCLRGDE